MTQSDPCRGASNLAGRSGSEPVKPRNGEARLERIAGILGVPSRWSNGEGHVGIEVLEHIDVGLPGVGELPRRIQVRRRRQFLQGSRGLGTANVLMSLPISFISVVTVRAAPLRSAVFSFENAISIGLRSGE